MMASDIILPRFIRALLGSCPSAGDGVHSWLFRTSRYLHAFFKDDPQEIAEALAAASFNCGRTISRREIEDAVRNSRKYAWAPGTNPRQNDQGFRRYWPPRNNDKIRSIAQNGGGLCDLWEKSPRRFEDNLMHTEEILSGLFPGNPLLCCGQSQSAFATRPRSQWQRRLRDLQFLVPSPMSRELGLTQEGKESAHTLDNTGPRRFLVVEFDFSPEASTALGIHIQDLCAALIFQLWRVAPLTLVVHSGGKSLHAWFYCLNEREQDLERFMRYAVSLGADPHTWLRSQFVRMPDGTRSNGKRQTAYFFDPNYKLAGVRR
jgi:hypothetical protein